MATTPEQREDVQRALAGIQAQGGVSSALPPLTRAERAERLRRHRAITAEVRSKALPYTQEERETQRSCATEIDEGRKDIFPIHPRHTATRIKRYEATLLQVEAERGTYRYAVEAFLGDETAEVCIERHERMSREATDMGEYERHGMIAAALRKCMALVSVDQPREEAG